jgi:hypothetical protein
MNVQVKIQRWVHSNQSGTFWQVEIHCVLAGAGFMNVYGSGTDNVFDNTWRRRLWKKSNVDDQPLKGDLISKELAVSLRRYPDTKPLFSAAFFSRGLKPTT